MEEGSKNMGNAIIMMVYIVMISMFALHCTAQNLTACIAKVDLQATNIRNVSLEQRYREDCCAALTPLVKSDPTEASASVCEAVISKLKPAETDYESAEDLFDGLISYCEPMQYVASFDSTKCAKLPVVRSLDDSCKLLVKNASISADATEVAPCCNSLQKRFPSDNDTISIDDVARILCNSVMRFFIQDPYVPHPEFPTYDKAFTIIATKCFPSRSLIVNSTICTANYKP